MAKNQSPCVSKGIQGLVWEAGYLKDMLSFFYSNVKAKMRLLLREGTLFLAVKTMSKKIPTPHIFLLSDFKSKKVAPI